MSKCKYCEAELIYIKTPSGRQMPCEAWKIKVWRSSKGRLTVCTDEGEVFRAETEPVPFVGDVLAYPVHFANCPNYAGK